MKEAIKNTLVVYGSNPTDAEIGLIELLYETKKRVLRGALQDDMIQKFHVTRGWASEAINDFNKKDILKIEIIKSEEYVKIVPGFYVILGKELIRAESNKFLKDGKDTLKDFRERHPEIWEEVKGGFNEKLNKASFSAKEMIRKLSKKFKDLKDKK